MRALPKALKRYLQAETKFNPDSLAAVCVQTAHSLASKSLSLDMILAASFDLIVAAKFYRHVKPENWLWCESCAKDFYPILNACPYCVLESRFVRHDGHKPGSGTIGPATAEALREILVAHYAQKGKPHIKIFSGSEPVDLGIADEIERNIFVAETKASPLFTPPLAIEHSADGFDTTANVPLKHSKGTIRNMHAQNVTLFIPTLDRKHRQWKMPLPGLGQADWPEKAMVQAIKSEPSDFSLYVNSWAAVWKSYAERDTSDPIFWFGGACGLPPNPGEGWPKRSDGTSQGSISDGKTSVGMDRTDDIKKGTFQVLRLGVDVRRVDLEGWKLKIGLASNLHAARHYRDYLQSYEDIVWGWAPAATPPDKWYNLFDGIISFSKSHTRDEWIRSIVDWHKQEAT